MSAKYDKKLGSFFTQGFTQGYDDISPQDEMSFALCFDESADENIMNIEHEMRETALLRKVCWIKSWLYLPEYWLTYILINKTWATERKEQQHYYSQMRKGKMNIYDFQKGLLSLSDKFLKLKEQDRA